MEVIVHWVQNGIPHHRVCPTEGFAQAYIAHLRSSAWMPDVTHVTIEPLRPCVEHFTILVHTHDLTHMMSDDGAVQRLGAASYARIRTMAEALPREAVERIWNGWVDTRGMRAEMVPQWYWRW
jgi:hypothetical protein